MLGGFYLFDMKKLLRCNLNFFFHIGKNVWEYKTKY